MKLVFVVTVGTWNPWSKKKIKTIKDEIESNLESLDPTLGIASIKVTYVED